jgi:hypothetical protein
MLPLLKNLKSRYNACVTGSGCRGARRTVKHRRIEFESLEDRMLLTNFAVLNTFDSGAGSLRQAILDANANVGPDTIEFNITGPGVHTIQPVSALPTITDSVVIDGYTQPGAIPTDDRTGR